MTLIVTLRKFSSRSTAHAYFFLNNHSDSISTATQFILTPSRDMANYPKLTAKDYICMPHGKVADTSISLRLSTRICFVTHKIVRPSSGLERIRRRQPLEVCEAGERRHGRGRALRGTS